MTHKLCFLLVVSRAVRGGKPQQSPQPVEHRSNARLILADGTEYQGAVIDGTNRKRFKKNDNRLLLTFALDRTGETT